MNVTFDKLQSTLPLKWQTQTLKAAFLDTGGSPDNACLTVCRVEVPARVIYVTGAMFWKLSEKDNILFATIRNDIAKLHLIHKFDLMGCETNNYGRNEIESLRREYGISMIGINTTGKITDKKKIKKGLSMDKNAIIKFPIQNKVTNEDTIPDNRIRPYASFLCIIVVPSSSFYTCLSHPLNYSE